MSRFMTVDAVSSRASLACILGAGYIHDILIFVGEGKTGLQVSMK